MNKVKQFTDKANRFIQALSKRNDEALNKFFIDLAKTMQSIAEYSDTTESEFDLHEWEKTELRDENLKLRKMLDLLCNIRSDDIELEEIEYLHNLRGSGYYTAKTLFDDLLAIRELKTFMSVMYPERKDLPPDRATLTKTNVFLNEKIWDLISKH